MSSIFQWFLLFSELLTASLAFTMYMENQLHEGNECNLENGERGVCKKLPECPLRLAEVHEGRRTSQSTGRCGFEKFVEIVCCPMNVTEKIGLRPAEIACQEYNKEMLMDRIVPLISNVNISATGFSNIRTVSVGGGVPVPSFWTLGTLLSYKATESSEFPYMVALGYENIETEGAVNATPITYTCGGTLISDQHVLTAAHCIGNINKKVPIEVRLGAENLNSNSPFVQRIPIDNIVPHPRYRRSTNYNDLAVLKLKRRVQFTNTVQPICMQTKPFGSVNITVNSTLVVIGWGATSFGDDGSPQLMRSPSLNLVERETCAEAYTDFFKLPHGIDENMLCAVDRNTSRFADACQGDSGGPLLLLSKSGDTLVGVTAFGQACGGSTPGVYMGVYPYLDWIEQQVWENST